MKPKVSIIIPVRFRKDLTEVCIDSILNYTNDCEIIVVQEGEDEDIWHLLTGYSVVNQVKYIQNKVPKGYAGALNAGLAIAKGDYVCFMNNDTVVTPNWMDGMLKAFDDKDKNVGLVSPTFWGTGDRQSVDWNNGDQFDYVVDPMGMIGVCYLMSRECINKVGIWDESFGHGGEDFDMTIRVQNAGYSLCIARRAFIYHYGGASTRIVIGNDMDKVRANQIEKLKMVEKKHNIDIINKFKNRNG